MSRVLGRCGLWFVVGLVACLMIAGCGRKAAFPDAMAELAMPAERFYGAVAHEIYGNSDDLKSGSGPGNPVIVGAMERTGLLGSAQFRYPLIDPSGTTLRVRVDRYANPGVAAEQFRGRHLPQALAMTQPLDAGDDGFIHTSIYAGVRVGVVVVEARAVPGDARLEAFMRAYVEYLETFDQN